ncbi:DUF455 family protein [Alicyclobacillus fodiniaquatilis]|uniref:DUF455 family protein n=1 Tax=Alicyclobacillus fodiniaquatilis TaxID=1661150 RepID=A0ABW4JF81_9BACL
MLPFSGIENPYKIGAYSVDTNAKVLQRYRFVHDGLVRLAAGQLPARENWDLKLTLAKHIYEDAEATDELRNRIRELRSSQASLQQAPDAALSLLLEELIHAQNDLELLVGIYEVVRPALLATYQKHMSTTQQIVDQPTIRILRTIVLDLEAQIQWGNEMIASLRAEGEAHEGLDEFKRNLQSLLAAAGGIDGAETKSTELPRRWRSQQTYQLPMKSVRDPKKMGPTTWARTSVPNLPDDAVQQRLVMMMRVRQEEMTAVELIAAVLYAQQNMPWEFYHDLARHLWDEARHSMFGQAALEAAGFDWMHQPQYTSDYDVNVHKIPGVKYTWLSIGIEEGAMKRTGKRAEYEFCRDEAKHPLMTQFQDYDWADEVVHANLGRKWTPELLGEDIEFVRTVAQHELDHFWEEVQNAQQQWMKTQSGA